MNESDIDLLLFRSLKMRFELGLFDPIENQPYWQIPPEVVNNDSAKSLSLEATLQSMTLLQNPEWNEEPILPIKKGQKVAVIGPHAMAQRELVGNYLGQVKGEFVCRRREGGETYR